MENRDRTGTGLRSHFVRTLLFPRTQRVMAGVWGPRSWCPLRTAVTAGLTSKDTSGSLQEFTVEETTESNMVKGIKTLSLWAQKAEQSGLPVGCLSAGDELATQV